MGDGSSRDRTDRTNVRRVFVFVLLCGALALLASSEALHATLLDVLNRASKLIAARPVLGVILFVVLSGLSAMLAFFSSAVLVPVALYTWGKVACVFLLWVGWILGGAASYSIGRFLGRPVVKRLLPRGSLARYENKISRQTPFGLILLLQLALPSEVPGYLLGVLRYPFGKYLLALAIAEVPYAIGTIFLGASFLDRQLLAFVGLGAAGALFMALALRFLQRRLQS